MADVGGVKYKISGDNSQFNADINQTKSIATGAASAIGAAFKAAAATAGAAVGAVLTTGITYNASMEQKTVALTTALGDEAAALETIAQIQKDAATTPFDVEGLTQANMMLISAGESAGGARDVVLALGDAISATGGGNDELSRMAANLQQVKNVGKATAADIKQFAMAGIDIYGLLADYTGKSTAEVKNMEVSYDLLTAALKNASAEGGRYYQSMAAQSKTFSGQLATLGDNAKTVAGQLTEGLFEKLASDVLPKINEALESIDVDAVIDGIGRLVNAFITIAPVVAGAAAAFLTFKAALALGGAITGLIEGFYALNAVLMANPVALVVAGLVGLAAACVGAIAVMDKVENEYKDLTDAVSETTTSYDKNIEAIKKTEASNVALAGSLTNLVAKEGKTKADKAAIFGIVNELNAAIPNLNLAYNEQADALNMTTEALLEYIHAQAEQETYAENVETLTEAYKEQAEITTALAEANNALTEAQAAYNAVVNGDTSAYDYMSKVAAAGKDLAQAEENVRALTKAQQENNAVIAAAEKFINEYAGGMDQMAESAENGAESVAQATELMAAAYAENYAEIAQTIEKEVGLFEKIPEAAEQSIGDLIGALESQIEHMNGYMDNLAEAVRRGLDEGLVAALSDGSIASAEALAAIVSGTDEQIQTLNETYREKLQVAEIMTEELAATKTAAEMGMSDVNGALDAGAAEMDNSDIAGAAGEATIDAYVDAVNAGVPDAEAASDAVAGTAENMDAAETAAGAGDSTANAYIDAINRGNTGVVGAARKLAEAAGDNLDAVSAANAAGQAAGGGFAAGLSSMISNVISAAKNLAASAVSHLKASLKINSPSKVMIEQGEFTGEGFAVGILNQIAPAKSAAESLAAAVTAPLTMPDTTAAPVSAITADATTAPAMAAPVVLELDGREVARATAWWTSEQMAWEEM